jgi:hypothetical protein
MDNVAQTPAVPGRPIPQEMWSAISKLDADLKAEWRTTRNIHRADLLTIGQNFGFSETELIRRGLLNPRANPNPEVGA